MGEQRKVVIGESLCAGHTFPALQASRHLTWPSAVTRRTWLSRQATESFFSEGKLGILITEEEWQAEEISIQRQHSCAVVQAFRVPTQAPWVHLPPIHLSASTNNRKVTKPAGELGSVSSGDVSPMGLLSRRAADGRSPPWTTNEHYRLHSYETVIVPSPCWTEFDKVELDLCHFARAVHAVHDRTGVANYEPVNIILDVCDVPHLKTFSSKPSIAGIWACRSRARDVGGLSPSGSSGGGTGPMQEVGG